MNSSLLVDNVSINIIYIYMTYHSLKKLVEMKRARTFRDIQQEWEKKLGKKNHFFA